MFSVACCCLPPPQFSVVHLSCVQIKFCKFSILVCAGACHSSSIAFRHLPLNSARIGYATEGALFISAQLSTEAVNALRKVWVLIRLWTQQTAQVPK